ncbi:MAG: DUF2203 domain-containing protein [Pirellulaceae bacterium]
MSESFPTPFKTFTVEEANASLPLVRVITSDIVHLSRDLIERRHRLELLKRRGEGVSGDPYADEIAHIREEFEKDTRRLEEFIGELFDLGVELQSGPDGLVDFPSEMEGRLVYLCWKFNEPEVGYWHELDAGFAGRQLLAVGSVSGPGADGEEGLFPGGST